MARHGHKGRPYNKTVRRKHRAHLPIKSQNSDKKIPAWLYRFRRAGSWGVPIFYAPSEPSQNLLNDAQS